MIRKYCNGASLFAVIVCLAMFGLKLGGLFTGIWWWVIAGILVLGGVITYQFVQFADTLRDEDDPERDAGWGLEDLANFRAKMAQRALANA